MKVFFVMCAFFLTTALAIGQMYAGLEALRAGALGGLSIFSQVVIFGSYVLVVLIVSSRADKLGKKALTLMDGYERP